MLAKSFVLGKDDVNKANNFDDKLQLTSTASAKFAPIDQKIGISEKIGVGASVVSDKVREVDQKFKVSEKTKSALAAAEQTVSTAGSAIMKNRYILTGASWVTGAFSKVSKAAGDVGQETKEKVENAEQQEKRQADDQYPQILAEPPKEFLVSNSAAGSVIGKGGSTISDFQSQIGARIQLSRNLEFFPGTTDRIIMVSGAINEIQGAVELILSKLLSELHSEDENDAEPKTKVRLIVPNGSCGGIICKGGATIRCHSLTLSNGHSLKTLKLG